jgi:hypothetical protein
LDLFLLLLLFFFFLLFFLFLCVDASASDNGKQCQHTFFWFQLTPKCFVDRLPELHRYSLSNGHHENAKMDSR